MHSRSSTVQATLVLELLDPDGDSSPVQAELRYDSGDPFAVRGDFCLDEQVVRWVFARSLLRTGLYEPTGSGDVRVRPWLDTDGRRRGAHRALARPTVPPCCRPGRDDVATFLRRTEGLVPPGCESAHVDLDQALMPAARPAGRLTRRRTQRPTAQGSGCSFDRCANTVAACAVTGPGAVQVPLVDAVQPLHVAGGARQEHLVGLVQHLDTAGRAR